MLTIFLLWGLLTFFLPTFGWGHEAKPGAVLESFLSSATEVATFSGFNIDQIPSSFTIFDRKMIERTGATTIAELLRFVPGLEVIRENNGTYHLIVRGNYSDRRVLILWDGQPLNHLLLRRALSFVGALPVDILERIEISRGPSSAVYGSYAVGGVINLVPRRWKNSGEIGGALGHFDTGRGFISGGFIKNTWEFQFSAGKSTSNGDRFHVKDAAGIPGTADTHFDTNWQEFRLAWKGLRLKMFRFDVTLSHYYGLSDRLGRSNDPENHYKQFGGQVTYDFEIAKETTGHLYFNWRQNILDYGTFYVFHPASKEIPPVKRFLLRFPDPYDAPTLAHEKSRLREIVYGFRLKTKWQTHSLRLGVEFLENGIRSSKLLANRSLPEFRPLPTLERQHDPWPPKTERMWAVYFQDEWELGPRDELNLGLRYDKYNGFNGQFSPRIVWIHRFTPKLISKFIYGHGFRIPDLDALYDDHSPLVVGNPDLDPEKLDSLELVLIWKPNPKNRLSLSLFRMWLRDVLGRRNPVGIGGWTYQQGGDEDVVGGEISYHYRGVHWDIYLYGSYQWGENEFDEPRPYVANVLAGGIISYTFGSLPLEINLACNYVGPRWREKFNPVRGTNTYIPDPRDKLDGYTNVNLKIIYDVTSKISAWFGVTNLFEDDIRYPSSWGGIPDDYQENGRYLEMGLRIRF
ncbi:MAG: TonB-dependent receptor [Thermodesulfobacteria bacterium]|nr:TonB-dependent receptor [Thermodesulfobacteriota bacterium]